MTFSAFIPIILFLVFTKRIAGGDDKCLQSMKEKGFVPKYAETVKLSNLQMEYAGKNASCGSSVTIVQTVTPPTLYYKAPSCCKNITVIAFSPDTPFFPPYVVWLVSNIPPENLRKGFTTPLIGNTDNNGDYLAFYDGPKSPTGSVEPKTFVIFVYCQCRYVNDTTVYKPLLVGRTYFDLKGYAKKYRLGTPMAASYVVSTAGVDLKNTPVSGAIPHVSV